MSESRDSRWMLIQGFTGAEIVRDLMRDAMRRLDDLDRNATDLAIPDLSITTAKLATGAVTLVKMAADAVGTTQLVNLAVTTAKIANAAVTKAKLAGGFFACRAITGGAAGDHTVTGIASGDELVGVVRLNRDATASNIDLTTITSEFTITGSNTINNAGGTNTTGDALLVLWLDLT